MSAASGTLSDLRSGKLAGATRLDLSCDLTSFPEEIFSLADSLEVLNLTGNRLSLSRTNSLVSGSSRSSSAPQTISITSPGSSAVALRSR
jgi:hypothetical protein